MNRPRSCKVLSRLALTLGIVAGVCNVVAADAPLLPLLATNVAQIQSELARQARLLCAVKLEGIVCAANSDMGAVVFQDESGTELFEMAPQPRAFAPGERIRIESSRCLLRRRETGIQISEAPVVDNDGLHRMAEARGSAELAAGRHRLCLEWFNCEFGYGLETVLEGPGIPAQPLGGRFILRPDPEAGALQGESPGLRVECFEGGWENVPNFDTLRAVRSGVTTTIDLKFATREEAVGLRFTGYFNAPREGRYNFRLRSDDGALLFLGDPTVRVTSLGAAAPPPAATAVAGESQESLRARRWVAVEGRVSFVMPRGRGVEFELRSEPNSLLVKVLDAGELNPEALLNSAVRVSGVSETMLTADQRMVLGRVSALRGADVTVLAAALRASELPALLTTAEQVRGLQFNQATRGLPVHIRGVVTSAHSRYYRGVSLQDATRGIYVDIHSLSNGIAPVAGEFWEVHGHTGPGDFAPVVIAERMKCLGQGQMPPPARPSWNQLMNGSMDVQWIELQGLVTGLVSNRLALLLPGGTIEATIGQPQSVDLRPFLNGLVRIRGTMYAQWNAQTRGVVPGRIVFRGAAINVDASGAGNPFDAPLKTVQELLHFDPQANGLQRVKVRGQVMHAGSDGLLCADGQAGLRILPAVPAGLRAGDLVEAAGYPEIGGPSPLLRQAVVRKTGAGALPAATALTEQQLLTGPFDAMRVRARGTLAARRLEKGVTVLEMQSGLRGFLARIGQSRASSFDWRPGSQLELTGVYAARGQNPQWERGPDAFELLVDSPADIRVLSQPPWWTLRRLLAALGVLSAVLAAAMLWVFQLRRRVEAQTKTIRLQIEQHATLEERGRIARELHDSLEQALAGISLQLDGFARTLGELPAESARVLAMARAMVRHGQEEARRTVRNLRMLPLENGDLPTALGQMARNAIEGSGINIEVDHNGPMRPLSPKMESHLLRIGQEATTNALKHARARNIRLRLSWDAQAVELTIHDDGRGFDAEGALPSEAGHFGLLGMRERAEKIGGTLNITSRCGDGTTVRVRVPLHQESRSGWNRS